MRNNQIHLQDLVHNLKHAHVRLDLEFLNKLLKNASKCEKPWRNKEFVQKVGCGFNELIQSSTTICSWKNGYRTVRMSSLTKIIELSSYSWNEVEKHLISIKAGIHKGEIGPKFPIEIGHQLGSIVGHILGDGAIDKRGHTVFYSNSNPELLNEFINYMRNVFGIEPRIWVQKKKSYEYKSEWLKRIYDLKDIPKGSSVGLFYPKICCDILHVLFGKFADGKKKCVTLQIKDSSLGFKKGFIRAFFDDEGSIRHKSHMLRFHQDKKSMLNDLKLLLKELGINTNPVRNYIKRNKKRYHFGLTGFNEYCRFYYLIGCTSSKKRKELESLIRKVANSKRLKNKIRGLPTTRDSLSLTKTLYITVRTPR